jgi:hypothetical protein
MWRYRLGDVNYERSNYKIFSHFFLFPSETLWPPFGFIIKYSVKQFYLSNPINRCKKSLQKNVLLLLQITIAKTL